MEKQAVLAVLFVAIFFFSYLLFGFWLLEKTGKLNNTQDFIFHYEKARGENPGNYKPLYHFLFSVFSQSELLFYSANLFLIVVAIPLLLFFLTKNIWAIIIYFCGVSFPHWSLFAATYPAALIVFLFLVYLDLRNRFYSKMLWVAVFFLFVTGLIHSFGSAFFLCIFLSEIISFEWKIYKPLIISFAKSFLTEKALSKFSPVVLLPSSFIFSLSQFKNIFFNHLPVQTVYFAIKRIDSFFFLIIIASIFGMLSDFRAIIIPQIICCIAASDALEKFDWKTKRLYLFFLMAQLLFYLVLYLSETIKVIVLN